jgi:sugar diacid utilization regulator
MIGGKYMSKKILQQKPKRGEDVEKWIQQEVAEQRERYAQIAQAMNVDLAEQREVWIREFYERITTTGFYWHADNKKIVKKEELFQKPDREFKVVF